MDLKEEDILGADIGLHWLLSLQGRCAQARSRRYRCQAPARRRRGLGLLLAPPAGGDRGAIGPVRRHRLRGRPRRPGRHQAGALSPRLRDDRLRPRADDGRAGACRRRSRPVAALRGQGAGRRALPGDGARLPLPVERPRCVSGAQAALHAQRDRGGDARGRPSRSSRVPTISAWSSRSPRRCGWPRAASPSRKAASRSTAPSPMACSPRSAPPSCRSSRSTASRSLGLRTGPQALEAPGGRVLMTKIGRRPFRRYTAVRRTKIPWECRVCPSISVRRRATFRHFRRFPGSWRSQR